MSGLGNIGNTCGINSLIQCINSINILKHIILNCNTNSEVKLSDQFKDVLSKLNEGYSVTPGACVQQIYKTFSGILNPGEQLDIGELWMLIGDKFADEYGIPIHLENSDAISSQIHKINSGKSSDWLTSIQGVSLSVTECHHCRNQVVNPEVFITLSIDFLETNNDNEANSLPLPVFVSDMIRSSLKIDELSEWRCDECKQVGGRKQSQIYRLAPVLVILLKRFKITERGTIDKIHNPVNIQTELNFDAKCSYKLKAIGNHFGGYHGGHYTAACVDKNNNWKHYDDNSVSDINPAQLMVNNHSAYMLFYESI